MATAAIAAVFLFSRNGQQEPGPTGILELLDAVMTFLASGTYLIAVGLAGAGIFARINVGSEERTIWKRHRTHEAFGAFWTILVMTAFMAFTTFTLPTMLSWRQEQETKAGEPTGTAVIQTTFEIQITPDDILDTGQNSFTGAVSRALRGTRFDSLQVTVQENRLIVESYPEGTVPTGDPPYLDAHMSPRVMQWLEEYNAALDLPQEEQQEALSRVQPVTLILEDRHDTLSLPDEGTND